MLSAKLLLSEITALSIRERLSEVRVRIKEKDILHSAITFLSAPGAKVLGPFKVGNNVKIAANAVVLNEIPDNSTAVGVPARVVRKNGAKVGRKCVTQEIDQVHIPDPVSLEFCRMQLEIDELKNKISALSSDSKNNKE